MVVVPDEILARDVSGGNVKTGEWGSKVWGVPLVSRHGSVRLLPLPPSQPEEGLDCKFL